MDESETDFENSSSAAAAAVDAAAEDASTAG